MILIGTHKDQVVGPADLEKSNADLAESNEKIKKLNRRIRDRVRALRVFKLGKLGLKLPEQPGLFCIVCTAA